MLGAKAPNNEDFKFFHFFNFGRVREKYLNLGLILETICGMIYSAFSMRR